MNTIPTINPAVKYRTVAALKRLLLPDLESILLSPIVIQDGEGEPLAVLIPWQSFVELQEAATNNPDDYGVANRGTQ